MKRAALVCLAAFSFGTVATGSSQTVITTLGFEPYQTWLRGALVPGPVPEIRTFATTAGCESPGWACARTTVDPPEVWMPSQRGRALFFHEVGHIAHDELSTEERAEFERIDGQAWNPEHFADGYMHCALGDRLWGRDKAGAFPSWKPSRPEYRQTCALIRGAL